VTIIVYYIFIIYKKKKNMPPGLVLRLVNLINGFMITPKIEAQVKVSCGLEALHRMIDWFNLNNQTNLKPLGLDYTPILSNYWLAGLIDADGSFYFNWLYDNKGLPTILQYYMRVTQRQNYHKLDSLFNFSYFHIMNRIATDLSVPLRYRNRIRKNNFKEESYEVRTANYISNYTILSYLTQYPLFSYKYINVAVQLKLLRLSANKNYKHANGLTRLVDLKKISKGDAFSPLNYANQKLTNHYKHIDHYFTFYN